MWCTNETHPAHIIPYAADDRRLDLALHLRDHERPAGAGVPARRRQAVRARRRAVRAARKTAERPVYDTRSLCTGTGKERGGRERWTRGRGAGAKGQEERKGKKQEYDTRTRGRNHAGLVRGRAATNVWRWGAGTGGEEVQTRAADAPKARQSPRPKRENAATRRRKAEAGKPEPRCPHETPSRRRGNAKEVRANVRHSIEKNGTGQGRSREGVGDEGDWMKGAGRGGNPGGRRKEGAGMEDGKEV
ncbi:hypothetical protein C8J57DRAFT_1229228 [Mycena rebaudengoi]|nr:hypothetical protein C8J57DRAFT_1229228 [Mycena rebaudengoi]